MSHFFARVRRALKCIEMVFMGVLDHAELIVDNHLTGFGHLEVGGTRAWKIRVVTLVPN